MRDASPKSSLLLRASWGVVILPIARDRISVKGQTCTLERLRIAMSLHVLAYNLKVGSGDPRARIADSGNEILRGGRCCSRSSRSAD